MLRRIHGIWALPCLLIILVVAAACGGGGEEALTIPVTTPTPMRGTTPSPTPTSITGGERPIGLSSATVTLDELDNSGQSGTAVLTQVDRDTEVVIDVTPGPPESDPQPAGIHQGKCDDLGDVRWELNGVVGGESTSLIKDIPFSMMQFVGGGLAIYKSEAEKDVVVACGNLPIAFEFPE